jgi:hypothetical protein
MIQNFFNAKNFDFTIKRLPNVEFFVQGANIPGLNIDTTVQATPFAQINRPGNKLLYDELMITMAIDENLIGYKEIYNWMSGMTSPNNFEQYQGLQTEGGVFSDGSLIVLNSKGNATIEFKFSDLFPVSISSIQMATTNSTTEYLTTTVGFKYTTFEIVDI